MCLARAAWVERGCVDESIGFGLYQSCMNIGSVGCVSVFGLRWCGGWVAWTRSGRVGWCYVCVSWKRGSDVRCQLITCSLASCLKGNH